MPRDCTAQVASAGSTALPTNASFDSAVLIVELVKEPWTVDPRDPDDRHRTTPYPLTEDTLAESVRTVRSWSPDLVVVDPGGRRPVGRRTCRRGLGTAAVGMLVPPDIPVAMTVPVLRTVGDLERRAGVESISGRFDPGRGPGS
ncbi:hypothetical protein [Actinoalloteichus caeruleus]|uniref:hypothetical protein n=1 Tax=Actinoalloteichus cyanogriseus TaxID=2893586 RepID=UPI000AA47562|nr:hypothetical protein [Actinoalloteichus caeruleus]